MNNRRRLVIGVTGVAISFASLALLSQIVDIGATVEVLRTTDGLPIALAVGVIATELLLRSFRWASLLPDVDHARIPVGRLVPIVLVGYLGNTLLPARLGEVVRAYLVTLREKVGFDRSLGTVVLERVLDLATLAVVATFAAWIAGAPSWLIQATTVASVVGLSATAFLVIVGVPRIVHWLGRHLGRSSPLVSGVLMFLHRFGEGAGGQTRRVIGVAIGISAVCWLLDGSLFWLMGRAVGVDIPLPSAVLVAAVTVLSTAIPSAPGYIGTFELAAVTAADAVGIPPDEALAMALLAHAVSVVPLAIGGVVALASMSMSLGTLTSQAVDRRRNL